MTLQLRGGGDCVDGEDGAKRVDWPRGHRGHHILDRVRIAHRVCRRQRSDVVGQDDWHAHTNFIFIGSMPFSFLLPRIAMCCNGQHPTFEHCTLVLCFHLPLVDCIMHLNSM